MDQSPKPALCSAGHVVVVSAGWPPTPGGSSVLMRNLLEGFDPESYTVVTTHNAHRGPQEEGAPRVVGVLPEPGRLGRLGARLTDLQTPVAAVRTLKLLRATQARVVVAAYPDLHLLGVAMWAARRAAVPVVGYLHDTVAEANAHRFLYNRITERLQARVLRDATHLFVMSQGMSDLYQDKYQIQTTPLEHTYMEPIPKTVPDTPAQRTGFWAGAVYGINRHALGRVTAALGTIDTPLEVASRHTVEDLAERGITGTRIETSFYGSRPDYLTAVQQKGVLILALDGPDESPFHRDELATIFPTKTPEYLASGRPILVHCPDDYFLARFFKDKGCGQVISERSESALAEALAALLENAEIQNTLGEAALNAAHMFQAEPLRARFQHVIERASRVRYGDAIPESLESR